MSMTVYGYIDTLLAALDDDTELAESMIADYGRPPLLCSGAWFGSDRQLGYAHAPFVAVEPGVDAAALEICRAEHRAAPAAFTLIVAIGLPMTLWGDPPPPPPPKAEFRTAPVRYSAGGGTRDELTALRVVDIATRVGSDHGLRVTDASMEYSGNGEYPLAVYTATLRVEAAGIVDTGYVGATVF